MTNSVPSSDIKPEQEFDSDAVRNANPLRFAEEIRISAPFKLENGGILPEIRIVYETYGKLNTAKNNVILVCHALSGDSHAAAHSPDDDPGWWDILIGPGKPLDTNKYFVICSNCLGGCRGTTGPDSINPETGHRYGMDFPEITIGDIVEVQRLLLDNLGIDKLLCVIGGSLGGANALEWTIRYPARVVSAIPLASGAHLTSQALAFDIVARNAIHSDPNFHEGKYHEKGTVPADGLAIARMLGHITYLSRDGMMKKFGSARNHGRDIKTKFETKFSVGSYLAHQGDKFVERFDANSYLVLSTALDNFNLGETPEELQEALRNTTCRWLILSFSTDWLFPPFLSREITDALLAVGKRVNYCNIQSECGHDAFLLSNDFAYYGEMIRSFIDNTAYEQAAGTPPPFVRPDRLDYDLILDLFPKNASVLDLGCGRGGLLARLRQQNNDNIIGIEVKEKYVLSCIQRGIDVVQADLNEGLNMFADGQFDFVVLSKTLQTVLDVEFVLDEMLRVGKRCIVSFPNLGYKDYRKRLCEEGLAPNPDAGDSVHEWYKTQNVRFLTLTDFEEFCRMKNIQIYNRIALDTKKHQPVNENPNENADMIITVISERVKET
ncbi:MAG: homoserine O-acetyltransferase [Planctomycetaceae bacterium]|nr:homoserine O-acetyltransferase [Planctomycetaceae bacterium]